MSPEALAGGPIGKVRDGDEIEVDVEKRRLEINISEDEFELRMEEWSPPPVKYDSGVLGIYSRLVGSAAEGAVIDFTTGSGKGGRTA